VIVADSEVEKILAVAAATYLRVGGHFEERDERGTEQLSYSLAHTCQLGLVFEHRGLFQRPSRRALVVC
jgi:hypothetical protein